MKPVRPLFVAFLLSVALSAYASNPQVASLSPVSGPVGTQVQINGSGFGTVQGSATFSNVSASIVSWSDTQILATVPSTAVTGGVQVVAGGVNSNNNVYFSVPVPQVANISPTSGTVGTQVTINGSGFQATSANGTVGFNGTGATVVTWSDTQIVATVPNTSTGPVTVTVNAQQSNQDVLFTMPNPVVRSLTPSTGEVGTAVTVSGSGFGTSQSSSTISFAGNNATVSSWSDTQIVATVPNASISGSVVVKVGSIASNSNIVFTVPAPQVSSISPATGVSGTSVTIHGTGFQATQGSGSITFNGHTASVTSWSDTQIVATAPSSTTTGPVVVRVNLVSSNGDVDFTFPNPFISAVQPTSGPVGTQVQIDGSGFGATQGSSTISFNGTNAAVTSWSDGQIVATVPNSATSGYVKVTVSSVASNANVDFTIPPANVTGVSPTSGSVGTQVTIIGSGFQATQGGGWVTLNGATATITSWSDTQIVATVPSSATTGPVRVWPNNRQASNQDVIFTMPNPYVASLSPTTGSAGSQVTINGSGFGATQGSSSIAFNGTTATVSSWSDAQIVATVPMSASSGAVKVTVGGIISNTNVIFTLPTPTITGISPTNGTVGSQVTLSGTGFRASQGGAGFVSFNGSSATVVSWSDTQIVATVPSTALTGPVQMRAADGTLSNKDLVFTMPSPAISSITPTSGPVGTVVTVNGSGFGSAQGSSTIKFYAYAATVSSWSDTQIVASVPTSAVSGNVWVTNGGVNSNNASFTVGTLTVGSIAPTAGPVGTQITVTGTGFGATQGSSVLSLNGTAATASSWSDGQIIATVPSGATSGTVKVTVGSSSSNANITFTVGFDVSSISPTSGVVGTQVQINGTGFGATQGSSWVSFNGTSAQIVSWSSTQIVAKPSNGAITGPVKVIIGGVSSNADAIFTMPSPQIASLVPSSGRAGTQVQINGKGFGASQGTSTVNFYSASSTSIVSWSDTQIVATVPTAAVTGTVTVTEGGVTSPNAYFTVPSQVVTSVSPTTGVVGTQVTVYGAGFQASQGSSSVRFNNYSATVSSWSDTQIVATVSSGASTGPVQVYVNGFSSNSDVEFTMPNPAITALSPSSGAAGAQVQVNGIGFGATQGSSTIAFNGTAASVSAWGDTQITAVVPTAATSGPVKVTEGGVNGNSNIDFTIPAPQITSISPAAGLSGTSVTVNGSGFQSTQGSSYVRFNGVSASPTSWSSTQIVVPVPSSATTGPVTVAVNGISSNNDVEFTLPNPNITSMSPTSGPVGTQVTVNGTGFGATQGSNTLSFNGVVASITSWSDRQIAATIPSTATSGAVKVVNSGVSSNTNLNFTVPLPHVTSVSPSSGVAGTQVTVTGSGFQAAQGSSSVYVGGVPPTVVSWSDTQIVATVAQQGARTGPIYTTVNSTTSNQDVMFTMPNPIVSNVSPTKGPVGTQVTVNGLGFGATQGSSTVAFNGSAASVLSWSDTQILAAVPNSAVSGPVQVSEGGITSPGDVDYTVPQSQVTSISPNIAGGGNTVTVSGTGFQATQGSSWLAFNGSSAPITSWSDTQIVAKVPAGAVTGPVRAVVNSVQGGFVNFTVPNLAVSTVSPSTGPVGTQVTISGAAFGATQGSSLVEFNGSPASATSWSDTQIVATVPVTATTGPVLVTVNNVNSNVTVNYNVPGPWISGFSPGGGGPGAQITVTGTGFQANQRNSSITFNGMAASVVNWSDTQIVATVPSNVSTGPVAVTVNGVSYSYEYNFNVPNPVITSITPPAAAIGGTITVNGSGFLTNPPVFAITVNGVQVTNGVWNWTDSGMTFRVPPGTASGPVIVSVYGVTSNSVPFTVEGTPTITGVSTTGGVVGSTVAIMGSGFGPSQSTSTVDFNGTVAQVSNWTDTEIDAMVPANSMTGPIGVTVAALDTQTTTNFQIESSVQVTDSEGNVTNYMFGMQGGNWHTITSQGSGCSSCTVRGTNQYDYDSSGNILDQSDALNHEITYAYDGNNNLISQNQALDQNTNVNWTYTYNGFGEVLTATDPLGNVITNTYDTTGNLLTITTPPPDANTAASVTQFGYNSLGEMTTITEPINNVTTLTYTPAGLIQTITDSQNNATSYGYDARGNPTSVVDAMNHETDFAYDTGDRLTTITYADHTTTTFGYDYRGRRTSVTDQNGKTTTYAYDDADRLVSVTDAANNVTQFAYDDEDNLVSITDANSHITEFQYDSYGRLKETDFPSGHAETYTYDALGNLIAKLDRNGNATTYVYDALNRLTHKGYPDSTGVDYVYDLVGKIKQATDPTGTYGFAYDNMGRLIATTTQYAFLPNNTYTNSYTYDAASNRTNFTAPDGSTNSYVYDSLNRLSTLTNSLTGQFGFSYDALSRPTSLSRPNGVTTSYSYDALSRLLSILHQAGGATIDGATYVLDNAGNRTSKVNWLNGVAESYVYDAIYELTQVQQTVNGNQNTAETYSYDAVGNRLSSLNITSYSYNNSNELTSSSDGYSYTYDYNGNVLTKTNSSGTTQYAWDFENRLNSVALPNGAGVITFNYDPFRRRIYKSSPEGVRSYVYDGANTVEELDGSGHYTGIYTQAEGVDEPLAEYQLGGMIFYQADALGSITSVSAANAQIENTYTYSAFGSVANSSGSLSNSFLYTAREWDSETSLQYSRARYYDANIGRFLSEDPVGFSENTDFYAYVRNHPTDFTDPSGLKKNCLTRIMLVTAYCDKGPGTDWPHFKPKKKGGKAGSVGPGTVAVANSTPRPYPFGCSVTVYGHNINLGNAANAGPKDVTYSGSVHDTGAGWDPGHHDVLPGQWVDIWKGPCQAARNFGVKYRIVKICCDDCDFNNADKP